MSKKIVVQSYNAFTGITGPVESESACIHVFSYDPVAVSVGTFVFINLGEALPARANSSSTLAYGIVTKLLSTTTCEVMSSGVTTLTVPGATAGDFLYLSDAEGGIVTEDITALNSAFLQPVARVLSVTGSVCTIQLLIAGAPAHDLSNLLKLDRFVYAANNVGNGALVIGDIGGTLTPTQDYLGVYYKLKVNGSTSTEGLFSSGLIETSVKFKGDLLTSKAPGGSIELQRDDNDGIIRNGDELGQITFSGKLGPNYVESGATIVAKSTQNLWGDAANIETRVDINVAATKAAGPVTALSIYPSYVNVPGDLVVKDTLVVEGDSFLLGDVELEGSAYPFTASHVYKISSLIPTGAAVVINSGEAQISSTPMAKNCVGIAIQCKDLDFDSLGSKDKGLKVQVAAVGDNRSAPLTGFLICDEGGPVEPGDLVCTSSIPGYLMKQPDDIVRSYTVGKVLQDVTFDADGKASGVYGTICCG